MARGAAPAAARGASLLEPRDLNAAAFHETAERLLQHRFSRAASSATASAGALTMARIRSGVVTGSGFRARGRLR